MLKNAYFLEKTIKIVSSSGDPPPDPRVVTPVYYCNFVEFISSGKCILFRSKKKQVTTANVLPLLLSHFFTYFFYSNSVSFVEEGHKNISCPRSQGTLATPLQQVRISRFSSFNIMSYLIYNNLISSLLDPKLVDHESILIHICAYGPNVE